MTIPEYFKKYVDDTIDLEKTPSIRCPFHNETSGKSFSYSSKLGIWRCFGACHSGGDVIDLHRLNRKIVTREKALVDYNRMLGIKFDASIIFEKKEIKVNEREVHRNRLYASAIRLAKNVDDYLELDYILSKVPFEVEEMESFCAVRGVIINYEESTDSLVD